MPASNPDQTAYSVSIFPSGIFSRAYFDQLKDRHVEFLVNALNSTNPTTSALDIILKFVIVGCSTGIEPEPNPYRRTSLKEVTVEIPIEDTYLPLSDEEFRQYLKHLIQKCTLSVIAFCDDLRLTKEIANSFTVRLESALNIYLSADLPLPSTLRELSKASGNELLLDLTEPFTFRIVFQQQAQIDNFLCATGDLNVKAFEVVEGSGEFVVYLSLRLRTLAELDKLEKVFGNLAQRYGGQYDGWEN